MYFNKQIFKEDIIETIETMKIIKTVIKYWGVRILFVIAMLTVPYYTGKWIFGSQQGGIDAWSYGIITLIGLGLFIHGLFLVLCSFNYIYKRYFKKPGAD